MGGESMSRKIRNILSTMAFLFFTGLSCEAIPRGGSQLPFDVSASPLYMAYWIAGILIAFAATARIFVLSGRTDDRHLRNCAYIFGLYVLAQFCVFLNETSWRTPVFDDATRLSSCILNSLMIIFVPRFIESRREWSLDRRVVPVFTLVGSLFAVHYIASAVFFFTVRYQPGLKYFDGHRILPAILMDFSIVAAGIYAVAAVIASRKRARYTPEEKIAIRRLAYAAMACIPAVLFIDDIRWLFPPLWNIYPQDDFLVTPFFCGFISIFLAGYARAYTSRREPIGEAGNRERLIVFQSEPTLWKGLSAREREVAALLAQGLTYKEICSQLHIRMGTVQTHVVRVYQKLGVTCKEDVMNLFRPHIESALAAIND
jgi:DNA-binding CsgD family transcriptional regulator